MSASNEISDENTNATPSMPLGGDYWDAAPAAPLWGFADLHAHLMAHLAFGGRAFWGLPYDPEHPGPDGIQHALASCEPIHGGLININPEMGHPAGGGWPEFIIWPRFTTLVHQQAYIDWLQRAYQGGLRLVTCLAVNNELLASKTSPGSPHDDKSAIQVQVAAMKEMVSFVDTLAGGPGRGWLQIAYSPEDGRRIIADNKLAILLGVEVDSLGNWHNPQELEKASHGDIDQARRLIGQELDRLYGLGIRQITPIHLANNAFGGTAIYMRFLETINLFLSGERWTVKDAWETGVRYRLDHDGTDLVDDAERTAVLSGKRERAMHRHSLLDQIPGIRDMYEAVEAPRLSGGHANAFGLNQYGRILLEEMMKRGMIIDVDHMSERSTDEALALAEQYHYPVICSHTWFRDLLYSAPSEFQPLKEAPYGTSDVHKVAHEAGKRGDQVERIGRLGGMVAPILNQGDIAGLKPVMPGLASKVSEPCAGSATAWAQAYLYATAKMGGRGVAMGSDINGAAGLPGPRFGTFAAYGAVKDAYRTKDRRGEIDRQSNGVAYRQPIRDHRWHRFERAGTGGYDEEESRIWQAIAQYEAGFNPALQSHPASDFPEPDLKEFMERLHVELSHDWIDHITLGFIMADQAVLPTANKLQELPEEQRAAYLACKEGDVLEKDLLENEHFGSLVAKIKAIRARWQAMAGDNRPLERSMAGPRRDFDINLDGMAHYGMLPDLLQEVRNIGLSAQDLAPLFRSAYDYVQMWDRCARLAADWPADPPDRKD